ncbi:phosphoglycolate phosphatase [Marinobacterium litorale]|uniref:phosphoglycolate phosphatase n=1 Tax=Marinobacterium litorale TaxID=404770 RepID=UPI0004844A95|nr:phosphoglycolate phosphatase [Marinobacterium litorale]
MSSVESVLFDLDGTLVDSVPDLARSIDQMLTGLGRPPAGESQVRTWVGNGAQRLVERSLCGGLEGVLTVEQEALLPAAMELFMAAYAQNNGRTSRVYAGVAELLEHLRDAGVPMAVVTNKPRVFTEPLLAKLGLQAYFGCTVSGDTLNEKKPSPRPILHACEVLGSTPTGSLMVGDSHVDVQAARAAGCPVVCVDYGYNQGASIDEAGADYVISSLAQLIGMGI